MDEKKRKIIIISLFVAIVLLFAFAIYYFFFRSEEGVVFPTETTTTTTTSTTTGFGNIPGKGGEFEIPTTSTGTTTGSVVVPPTPTEGGEIPAEVPTEENVAEGRETVLQPVVSVPVLSPIVSPAFNAVTYYSKSDGKFFKVAKNRTISLLSDQTFPSVDRVNWAPAGDKAVIEFPDGSNIIYDFKNKKQATLPKEMQDFSFAKDGSKIAFKWITGNTKEHYVGTVGGDGSDVRFLEFIGDKQDQVKVAFSPTSKVVATYREPSDKFGSNIFFVGQNEENFALAPIDGFGAEPVWSSTGAYLLYSSFQIDNSFKPHLWISTGDKDEEFGLDRQDLGIDTWSEKCTFNSNDTYLYCGVPKNLPSGAGTLKSRYINDTNDLLYRIDLKTLDVQLLAIPINSQTDSDSVNIQNILLSPDEKTLYFTDGRTGILNSVILP